MSKEVGAFGAGDYIWSITFPESLGDVPLLLVNGAGLRGASPNLIVTEVLRGKTAGVQKIISSGTSELSGYFYIKYLNATTDLLAHNIDAQHLEAELEKLPFIGDVTVSRASTGIMQYHNEERQDR